MVVLSGEEGGTARAGMPGMALAEGLGRVHDKRSITQPSVLDPHPVLEVMELRNVLLLKPC